MAMSSEFLDDCSILVHLEHIHLPVEHGDLQSQLDGLFSMPKEFHWV